MTAPLRSGSAYSVGAVVYAVVALLALGKLLTNSLPPEGVAQVALALLAAEFLGLLAGLGLPAALPKLLAAEEEAGRPHLRALLLRVQLKSVLALIAFGLAAMITRVWWPASLQDALPDTAFFVGVLALLVLVVTLRDFLLAAAVGNQAFRQRARAMVLMSTTQVLLFGTLYLSDSAIPLAFVGAHVLSGLLGIALLIDFRRDFQPLQEVTSPRPALAFAAPLYVNNLMNFLYQRADTLFIVAWLGLPTAALFEMAKRLPALLSRLLRAALLPYLPALAESLRDGDRAQAGRLIHQATALAAFTGYTVSLLAIALANGLLAFLFTADYQAAAPVLGLLLIATCLAVQAGIMGQALIALDQPWTVMTINLGLGAASLLLNLLLVPRFGILGAGWSAVAAAVFSLIMQHRAVARSDIPPMPPRTLFLHVFFVATLALYGVAGESVAYRLVAAAAFVVACLLSGAFSTKLLWAEGRP